MIAYDSNLLLLRHWRSAHRVAGEGILSVFGLTSAAIATLTSIDDATLHRWATAPVALAQPRQGLLTALRLNHRSRLLGYVAQARSQSTTPAMTRFAQPVNAHFLTAWRQNLGNADRIADAFGLDQEDQATLAKADETDLERWAALPLAVAIPRPGLLSMLHGSKPLRLATFHPLIIQP